MASSTNDSRIAEIEGIYSKYENVTFKVVEAASTNTEVSSSEPVPSADSANLSALVVHSEPSPPLLKEVLPTLPFRKIRCQNLEAYLVNVLIDETNKYTGFLEDCLFAVHVFPLEDEDGSKPMDDLMLTLQNLFDNTDTLRTLGDVPVHAAVVLHEGVELPDETRAISDLHCDSSRTAEAIAPGLAIGVETSMYTEPREAIRRILENYQRLYSIVPDERWTNTESGINVLRLMILMSA